MDDLELETIPEGGTFKKYLLGYAVPGALVAYGLTCLITGKAVLYAQRSETFYAPAAWYLGLCYLAGASYIHFNWGWGLSPRLYHKSVRAKKFAFVFGLLFAAIFAYTVIATAHQAPSP